MKYLILLAAFCLGMPAHSQAQAEISPASTFQVADNTFKGMLNVPRGYSLWINTRQTYDAKDRPIVTISIPSDYPSPTCAVEFEYTAISDETGVGRGYRWQIVPPSMVTVAGQVSGQAKIPQKKADEILYSQHPMGTYKPVLIRPQFTTYGQSQMITLCKWDITYTNSNAHDEIALEVWMNQDQDIMRKSIFGWDNPNGQTEIAFTSFSWMKH